jgi:2-polyprenyl-3-methyl-5-hydroxy-6-metoxy-1,4-benzoquinol methylase
MINLSNPSKDTMIVVCVESVLLDGDKWQHRVTQLLTNGSMSRDTQTLAAVLRGIADSWSTSAGISKPAITQDEARQALTDEWLAKNPTTPAEIAEFYRTAQHVGTDLDAWHATIGRQNWTSIVTEVAQQIGAKIVVDIGCGAGYELFALREVGIPELYGVEPNDLLRSRVAEQIPCVASIAQDRIPIEQADMLVCLDVLEHVVNPEAFLGTIATWAKPGCVLVESTATFDHDTPLHLEANRGWHPWHCLETHGWELIEARSRVRVWQKLGE